jgi:multidrug efflux system membrane fusion protein
MAYSKRRLFFVSIILGTAASVSFYYWPFSALSKLSTDESVKSANSHKHGKHKHDDNSPVAVSVETSRQTDFPVYLNALGTVTPLRSVIVRPRVSGEIDSIDFVEGQRVKQGDLLAQIDPRPLQIQLQQTQGQLLRDEALLENAKIDYLRYQTLLAQDSIAAQQTATQAAQVKQYQGIVEMDNAQVNNAKLQLSYSKVLAPIAGRVGLRQIDQGNLVQANETSLMIITQLQPISVVFTLAEDQVPSIMQRRQHSTPIDVVAYDRAGKIKLAEGKLVAVDNQIDASTGTVKLKAQFDNVDERLFANQFVNVKIHLNTLEKVTQISSAAIQNDVQGTFVYVVTPENIIQIRRIKVGDIQNDYVAVLENLAVDEMVVLEGRETLHDGIKINIVQKDGHVIMPISGNPIEAKEKTPNH